MHFTIFPPPNVGNILIFCSKSYFSSETMKHIILKLSFLLEVKLCANAGFSSYTMKLILFIQLSNKVQLIWFMNIILWFNLDWFNFSLSVSFQFKQLILVKQRIIKLTIRIFEIFACLNLEIKLLCKFSFFRIVGFPFGLRCYSHVIGRIYLTCNSNIFSGIFIYSKVTWINIWFIPEEIRIMANSILHDVLSPTMLITFYPPSCILWEVSIFIKFNRSSPPIKLIFLPFTF